MCEHHHDHDYDHPHDHGHTGLEERVAMLTYMLGHNQHHAQELHELAHDLGDSEAAQLIHDAVVDFEVGNKKLAEALAVLKGEEAMCLATVYRMHDGEKQLVCKNVAAVRQQEGALVFTDIMGVQTRVEAVLDRMDLMENFIFIKDAKA